MNEKVEEENLLSREVFVFSPNRGITMNVDPQMLPGHDDAANRFELIGNNPLIKSNKNNNLSEYDLYIEDPSNTEIKNELVNDISFQAGKCYLKKNAIDILYCGFDIFANEDKFLVKDSHTLNFYINILLTYPPELKHTSLVQYFATLHKVIENRDITLDYKYLVTNRALEIEWEKCNFIKYTHFKAFFASMKRFFKISPLFTEEAFVDENTTSIFQDLLRRTLAGRALSILQCIIDCDDQLKLLMLFKCIEWLQKLENLKMLINLNLSVLMGKGKDKVAVDLLKQMYGRSTMAFNMQGAEPSISPIPMERFEERPHPRPAAIIAKLGSSSDQTIPHGLEKLPEVKTEPSIDTPSKIKPAVGKPAEQESHVINRGKASESNSSRRTQRESIKEDNVSETTAQVTSNKMSGPERNQNKMSVFFDLEKATKYQDDYFGRINNFLKKALRLGYEFSSPDRVKIEAIINKFKDSYKQEQITDLIKNYKKFCSDYQALVNTVLIQTLEAQKSGQSTQNTPIMKSRTEAERSKSPPHNNMGALKMLKTTSEKFALQSNLGASLASNQNKEAQGRALPLHNEEPPEINRLSIKKDIERKSREKDQEEIKSSSGYNQDIKEAGKVKIERKKPDWTNFKVFTPGAGENRGFNDMSRSGRNYDE